MTFTKGLLFAFVCISFFAFSNAPESVLAKGNWYKISVSETGVHKIDYNFLKNIGIGIDNIDPRKIKIYGNGGGMLPQMNKTFRVDDLAENPIEIVGEADGKFNPEDYILFYAHGPTTWKADVNAGIFIHQKNIYSDFAYYFITYGENDGKRIETKLSVATGLEFQTEFDERTFYENDAINLLKSGREWLGHDFTTSNTFTQAFDMSGYVTGTTVKLKTEAALKFGLANGQSATINFQYKLNGAAFGTLSIGSSIKCNNCYQLGTIQSALFNIIPNNISNAASVPISVSANPNADPEGKSYLNYLNINFKKKLALGNNGQVLFRLLKPTSETNYQVSDASARSKVWNVTTPYNPILVANSLGTKIEFLSKTDSVLHEYVAFTPQSINLTPAFVGKVTNQNIHGLTTPDLLIVTHNSFLVQANELATYRRIQGIKTEVVTTDQVYNEFSSGGQDITAIRDACRMFYKRGGLKNLLLFGGCSFDYKDRIDNNTNFVPCYEAKNSFNSISSYSSEDYFAFFGDNEGNWEENGSDNYNMQIGIGRIPVRNSVEAQNVVNKLIAYETGNSFGKWRNKISFIADNGSNPGEGNTFSNDSERLSNKSSALYPNINVGKIYLDAYQDKSTPKGIETPGAAEAIRKSINQGALIVNYVGHGGTEGLSQEGVITKPTLESWENIDRLPFWVTATCDFSTYDDPSKLSGGVIMLTKPDGGGIGVISATRAVYSNTNYLLNNAFYDAAFKPTEDGNMPTLGEIIKRTKNQSTAGISNRSYSLIGDPSMTLNYPKYKAFVTKINDKQTDTVRALSEMKIEGIIASDNDSTLKSDFNGEIVFEIYDKADTFNTLGQQYSVATKIAQRSSIFYAGKTEVKNGKFSTNFIVPKDINYRFGSGKISIYAFDKNQKIDAGGYKTDFIIGGGSLTAPNDDTAPEIRLFMNDSTFKNGGLTNDAPYLLANLYDKSGINIARSSVGHEITAIIDGESNNPVILNDFYENALNTYQKGKVNYQLSTLAEGNHTLTLKAWDTYNNSSEQKVDFIVSNTAQIKLESLLNYPNPANEATTFQFIHNYAGQDLALDIDIIDRSGKLVYKISDIIINSSGTIDYRWDIAATNNIAAGTYVYRCKVRSMTNNSEALGIEKLVVIR
ncbi:MAG: type IX secretion system sortase PorU [Cytophagales bacterium]